MALEIEELGISINDNSLRKIIKSDKSFLKMKNFQEQNTKNFH